MVFFTSFQDCSCDLRNVAVYCKDSALYCEKDYKKNFVPLCSKCKEYILEVKRLGDDIRNFQTIYLQSVRKCQVILSVI